MPKKIVLCLDGTGNQLKAKGNTNVLRLFELLDVDHPDAQIAYYDAGLGTFGAQGAWTPTGKRITKLLGLAFGYGLRTNLGEAYTYLMREYEPGDRIYLFGFSRGAYTARALAGMLDVVGLLRPGLENLVPYAISTYCRSRHLGDEDWQQLHHFAATFARRVDGRVGVPIAYLGLWDSVKAVGVLRWTTHWPFTRRFPNVGHIRHAVSIDEKRRPYREYLVTPPEPGGPQRLEEVWFAGVHSDVGGTFEDDPRLSHIALKWMVDGALASGVALVPHAYQKACSVVPEDAGGRVHRMGWVWGLLTYRRRRVPADAVLHESVRGRLADPRYRRRIPDTVTWADEHWLDPTASA